MSFPPEGLQKAHVPFVGRTAASKTDDRNAASRRRANNQRAELRGRGQADQTVCHRKWCRANWVLTAPKTARSTSRSVDGSGTVRGIADPNGIACCRDSQIGAVGGNAAHACGTDATCSERAAGRQRSGQGKSARLTQRIARGVAGVDRHQAGAARRAADHQRRLNDVVGREIAAGIDLRRAPAVDVADLLICSRDENARGWLLFVMFTRLAPDESDETEPASSSVAPLATVAVTPAPIVAAPDGRLEAQRARAADGHASWLRRA